MTIAVMSARSMMRRRAVAKAPRPRRGSARSRAPPGRRPGRSSSRPAFRRRSSRRRRSGPGCGATALRSRRPSNTIGTITSGMPSSRPASASAPARTGSRCRRSPITMLRSATETVVPTTFSITAVSAVIREAISEGRFSSKKRGARRSRLSCTSARMSATTRSPSQRHEIEAHRGGDRQHDDDRTADS